MALPGRPDPPLLVRHLLERAADADPAGKALWHKGEWLTYGELDARADGVARALLDAGLAPGDRVAVMLENGFDFVAAHFGVAKAGGVNVSLNTELPPEDFQALVRDCGAACLVLGRRKEGALRGLNAAGLSLVLWEGDALPAERAASGDRTLGGIYRQSRRGRPEERGGETDLASIAYTSGSTGKPKGVMLTQRNLLSNTGAIVEYLGLTARDRMLAVLPFHYIYGQSLLYTHFRVGGSVAIDNRFAYPNTVLDTLAAVEATGFAGVPSTFMILLAKSTLRKRAFPALRYVTQAGGHMAAHLRLEVAEAFRPAALYVMYGTTEASPRLTYLPPEALAEKTASIGKAIPGVEVFVADDAGNPLPRGRTGQLVARGPNIMAGYWRDPAGTAEVLKDGLYFTGDLGREDEDGFLFIEGRSKDILKVGGNRVSAQEIEEAILAWGGALEAAVIGVEDAVLGEAAKAFIVPRGEADPEALKAWLKVRLPTFKQPKFLEFVEGLPKNSAGKVLKTVLKGRGTGPGATRDRPPV